MEITKVFLSCSEEYRLFSSILKKQFKDEYMDITLDEPKCYPCVLVYVEHGIDQQILGEYVYPYEFDPVLVELIDP